MTARYLFLCVKTAMSKGKRWQAKYLHDMLQYFVEVFENLKNFMQNPNSYD